MPTPARRRMARESSRPRSRCNELPYESFAALTAIPRLAPLSKLQDHVARNHVHLTGEVDAERGDGALGESPVLLIDRRTVLISEALEKAGAIVRIEIVSANGRDGAAAVNVAAGDRARSP